MFFILLSLFTEQKKDITQLREGIQKTSTNDLEFIFDLIKNELERRDK